MPELADLEAKLTFLNKRLPGLRVNDVQLPIAFIVRMPKDGFVAAMAGDAFGQTSGGEVPAHSESGRVLAELMSPWMHGASPRTSGRTEPRIWSLTTARAALR
jgi:hypothetical protein